MKKDIKVPTLEKQKEIVKNIQQLERKVTEAKNHLETVTTELEEYKRKNF